MAIDVVVDEVANNLEEVAEATRRLNSAGVGYFTAGTVFGFALGFYWGYKFNKEKIRAEAFRESREEVEKMREVYMQKTVAATPKPDPGDVVEEKGYTPPPPSPSTRPLPPPVPGVVEPVPVVVVEDQTQAGSVWNYPYEIQNRKQGEPYVIHQNEFMESVPGYNHVTYTYYAGDDVLVDEENGHPLPHADIVVGRDNLKFGHGTDDPNVVFVRNDKLELEMEICRTPDSYEEVVLGLEKSEIPDGPEDPHRA